MKHLSVILLTTVLSWVFPVINAVDIEDGEKGILRRLSTQSRSLKKKQDILFRKIKEQRKLDESDPLSSLLCCVMSFFGDSSLGTSIAPSSSAKPSTSPPSGKPTISAHPSIFASSNPSPVPSIFSSDIPSVLPSHNPSAHPSIFASSNPSPVPSIFSSDIPSVLPSHNPTLSVIPSSQPSFVTYKNDHLNTELNNNLGLDATTKVLQTTVFDTNEMWTFTDARAWVHDKTSKCLSTTGLTLVACDGGDDQVFYNTYAGPVGTVKGWEVHNADKSKCLRYTTAAGTGPGLVEWGPCDSDQITWTF